MAKNFVVKLRKERAVNNGRLARSIGKARESCPYKESFYSLRPLWLMGYDQQVELERVGKAVPHPSTHLTKRAVDECRRCGAEFPENSTVHDGDLYCTACGTRN